jgi:serine/threonine-protein kinase
VLLPLLEKVEVPVLKGMTLGDAKEIVRSRGLRLVVEGESYDPAVPQGLVIRQVPIGQVMARRGSEVRVTVSKGAEVVKIPDFAGLMVEAANLELRSLGLTLGEVFKVASDSVPPELVISSIPPAGSAVARGSSVALNVSDGSRLVAVPTVIGKDLAGAKTALQETGLTVGRLRYVLSETYDPGVVTRQNPAPGAQASRGTTVDLWIASEG